MDFEQGLTGDWEVVSGTAWDTVGRPMYLQGPDSCHMGDSCIGTNLKGNYTDGDLGLLASPMFEVPAASENPRLQFWHWIALSGSDFGFLEYRVEGGDWQITQTIGVRIT